MKKPNVYIGWGSAEKFNALLESGQLDAEKGWVYVVDPVVERVKPSLYAPLGVKLSGGIIMYSDDYKKATATNAWMWADGTDMTWSDGQTIDLSV